MTPVLQEQLEIVLRDEYRVLRELGGGGMSRVFLAEEVALGRKVVIKVLTPELAAGVNRTRFQREIQLLASLQHPLLVPVLAAGEGDGLVWYSMPYVEGESLRERLRRGPVPEREALAILVDMAQGLAEAHRRGVVHRDVKPENVLLSGGRAVLADFGIAKALRVAADAQHGLTASGLAVGTPAYMAPEQAAGDPDVDARADIYALGCVGYELLARRTPFEAPSPSQLLMAHVVQPPVELAALAPDASPALVSTLMRCLAKAPGDRWPDAGTLASALDEARYAGGVTSGARPPAHPTPAAAPRQRLAGVAIAALLTGASAWQLGRTGLVPEWARDLLLAFGVLLLGGVAVRWRRGTPAQVARLLRTSAITAGVLVAVVLGHGVLRAAGVGPFASIIASGKLAEQDRLLIAEFANRTGDTTLGDLVTDALRTDLQQSKSVRVLPRSDVAEALARMQRGGARLDSALAFELAQRTGIPAVLVGTIARLGRSVVISTRLVTPRGDELAGFREVAESDDEVIAAVDRLSKAMREKLGESLRSVTASPPLEEVTTGSLAALKKYTAALRVGERLSADAYEAEIALLEEAVKLDSTFAMAWRRLGITLAGTGRDPVRAAEALTRAFRLRERLTPVERSLAEAGYYTYVEPDLARQIAAYEAVLAADSGNRIALNNAASYYYDQGRWRELLATARRFVATDSSTVNAWRWYTGALWALGRDAEARTAEAAMAGHLGDDPMRAYVIRVDRLQRTGDLRGAVRLADSLMPRVDDPRTRASLQVTTATTDVLLGRLASARRRVGGALAVLGASDTAVRRRSRGVGAHARFFEAVWLHGDTAAARRALATFVAAAGIESWPVHERSIANLAFEHALVGDGAVARRRLDAYWAARRTAGADTVRYLTPASAFTVGLEALILQAERRPGEALERWRALADSGDGADVVSAAFIGFAYRQAGMADSALAAFRRWITDRDPRKPDVDQTYFVTPRTLRAGCQLADEVAVAEDRRFFCGRLAEFWRGADAELQPYVADARARVAREVGREVPR